MLNLLIKKLFKSSTGKPLLIPNNNRYSLLRILISTGSVLSTQTNPSKKVLTVITRRFQMRKLRLWGRKLPEVALL